MGPCFEGSLQRYYNGLVRIPKFWVHIRGPWDLLWIHTIGPAWFPDVLRSRVHTGPYMCGHLPSFSLQWGFKHGPLVSMWYFESQRENLKHVWLPYSADLREFELFDPWWLESSGYVMGVHTSSPQLPFKTPQIPANRDHKALSRSTLGFGFQIRFPSYGGSADLILSPKSPRYPNVGPLGFLYYVNGINSKGPKYPNPGHLGFLYVFIAMNCSPGLGGYTWILRVITSSGVGRGQGGGRSDACTL